MSARCLPPLTNTSAVRFHTGDIVWFRPSLEDRSDIDTVLVPVVADRLAAPVCGTHNYAIITQYVELTGLTACVVSGGNLDVGKLVL